MKKNKDLLKSDEIQQDYKLREKEVEESLRTIYVPEEGETPDMTKLDRLKSYYWIWVAVIAAAVVCILSATAWVGFTFFRDFHGFSGKGLSLTIEGPEEISLGQETTYFINYTNTLRDPLANAEVRVNFPTDFIITSVLPPASDKPLLWRLGALAAEQRGTITVRGRFTGALHTLSAIQAIATYRPADYSSDFEAMATKQVTYAHTAIDGWVQVPEKGIPGEHIAFIYHISNTASDKLDNLEARITLPEGFTPDQTVLGLTSIEGRVYKKQISVLDAGSSTEVGVTGVFASGYGGDVKVQAQLGRLSPDQIFYPMQFAEAILPVLAGDLSLKMVINGSDKTERSVSYGDTLRSVISYENTANEALRGITLHLKLEAVDKTTGSILDGTTFVDWDKVETSSTSTHSGNEIVWSQKDIANLKELSAHGSGSVNVSIPLLRATSTQATVAVRATVYADIEVIGDTAMKRTIQMKPIIFVFKSDAALTADLRYYSEEGAPLGSGPLPPQVGEQTTYRMIWNLNKTVHALKDLQISATLPNSVRYVALATSTAGNMVYDKQNNKITWTLNRMPEEVNNAEVEFDLQLTPSVADDGRFADLIGEITFQAKDEDINENLIQVIKGMNTDLQNDENAKGKGVVRKVVE